MIFKSIVLKYFWPSLCTFWGQALFGVFFFSKVIKHIAYNSPYIILPKKRPLTLVGHCAGAAFTNTPVPVGQLNPPTELACHSSSRGSVYPEGTVPSAIKGGLDWPSVTGPFTLALPLRLSTQPLIRWNETNNISSTEWLQDSHERMHAGDPQNAMHVQGGINQRPRVQRLARKEA